MNGDGLLICHNAQPPDYTRQVPLDGISRQHHHQCAITSGAKSGNVWCFYSRQAPPDGRFPGRWRMMLVTVVIVDSHPRFWPGPVSEVQYSLQTTITLNTQSSSIPIYDLSYYHPQHQHYRRIRSLIDIFVLHNYKLLTTIHRRHTIGTTRGRRRRRPGCCARERKCMKIDIIV